MFAAYSLIPTLFFLLWIGVIVYAVVLASRLVTAVEQIARAMTDRATDTRNR